jgi:hypothetical protein
VGSIRKLLASQQERHSGQMLSMFVKGGLTTKAQS